VRLDHSECESEHVNGINKQIFGTACLPWFLFAGFAVHNMARVTCFALIAMVNTAMQ
jgi:hypothetical protein